MCVYVCVICSCVSFCVYVGVCLYMCVLVNIYVCVGITGWYICVCVCVVMLPNEPVYELRKVWLRLQHLEVDLILVQVSL